MKASGRSWRPSTSPRSDHLGRTTRTASGRIDSRGAGTRQGLTSPRPGAKCRLGGPRAARGPIPRHHLDPTYDALGVQVSRCGHTSMPLASAAHGGARRVG
jgi:hypothetical protein